MDHHFAEYNTTENDFDYKHCVTIHPPQPSDFPIHNHNEKYELYYLLSGRVTFYIEGKTYDLQKNDFLIINTRELHRPIFDSSQSCERIVIHFDPNYISTFQNTGFDLLGFLEKRKPGECNKFCSTFTLNFGIDHYYKQLNHHCLTPSPEQYIMIKTIFIQLLITLNNIFTKEKQSLSTSADYDPKITAILDYINDHLNENITLSLLQQEFFLSKYYICHFFKKNTGFSVVEYITHKRIMNAKELLSNDIPITEVCHSVGFNDYSNFYKTFRKITGISPKEYIKLSTSKNQQEK